MKKHFKFIAWGSLITTLASYVGLYTLVRDQKLFIANYPVALSSTFILKYALSFLIWSLGLFLMLLVLKWKKNLSTLKAFYYSAFSLITAGLITYLLFYFFIMSIPFNPWFFIFPGIPILSALMSAPFLIKRFYLY